jgi:hypothetical protein
MAEIDDLQEELEIHRMRLHELRKQRAIKGISVDPSVTIEIRQLEGKIGQLESRLAHLAGPGGGPAPQTGPSGAAGGGSVFNQAGQQITTQYNVAGDLTINNPGPATPAQSQPARRPAGLQQRILQALVGAPGESTSAAHLAGQLGLDVADMHMHLDILKEAGLVNLNEAGAGLVAILTPAGRQRAQG